MTCMGKSKVKTSFDTWLATTTDKEPFSLCEELSDAFEESYGLAKYYQSQHNTKYRVVHPSLRKHVKALTDEGVLVKETVALAKFTTPITIYRYVQ